MNVQVLLSFGVVLLLSTNCLAQNDGDSTPPPLPKIHVRSADSSYGVGSFDRIGISELAEPGMALLPGAHDRSRVQDIVYQQNGKAIVALDTTVIRLRKDGSLDSSFGNQGAHTFSDPAYRSIADLSVGKDDSIYVLLKRSVASSEGEAAQAEVVKLTPSGQINPLFGTSPGHSEIYPHSWAIRLKLTSEGDFYILAAKISGTFGIVPVIARYTSQGRLDPTFGSAQTGLVTPSVYPGQVERDLSIFPIDFEVTPDGIYGLATASNLENPADSQNTIVYKLNHHGEMDTKFAHSGVYEKKYFVEQFEVPVSIVAQKGKIIVAGEFNSRIYLVRLDSTTGVPDSTFDQNGLLLISGGNQKSLESPKILPLNDGNLLIAGSSADNGREEIFFQILNQKGEAQVARDLNTGNRARSALVTAASELNQELFDLRIQFTPEGDLSAALALRGSSNSRILGNMIWKFQLSEQNRFPGDATADGCFLESDFIEIFQSGRYETDLPATYSQGDFNLDGLFNSNDLVQVFSEESYQSCRYY